MGLIKIFTGMGMAVLFAFAIMMFVTNFADDNLVYVDAGDDPCLSQFSSDWDKGFDTLKITTNESVLVLQEAQIESGDENVEGGGQFKTNPYSMFTMIKDIFKLGNKTILGGDVNLLVFTAAVSMMLSFIIGLYIWKTWKGGNPD